jgi:predicted Zn-dependent protease
VASADLKRTLDGVVFGADPRQGFMSGDTFQHPDLQFQLTLPHGWKVNNAPSAIVAVEPQKQAMVQLTIEKSQGLTPAQYAAQLVRQSGGVAEQGSAERIAGAEAYLEVLQLTQDGQSITVQTGFVARAAQGSLYQIVAYTATPRFAAYRAAFLGTIRSLQPLRDPAALHVEPNRVRVEALPSATTLESAVSRAGASPVPLGTVALLNNLQPSSRLAAGFQLKLVRGNYRPAGS